MKIYYPAGDKKEIKQPGKRPKKPDWYSRSERLLRQYKYLPGEIKNMKLQLRLHQMAGTTITSQLRQVVVQSSRVSSPSESHVTKEEAMEEKIERKEIQLAMLENVMKAFNADEAMVYKLRYEMEKGEKAVWMQMGMARSSYFKLQKAVVLKTALLMQMEVPGEDIPEE